MRVGRERLLENERNAVRELISVHPNEFTHDTTMFDRLVRMQHFNLPTRLLDVSANPLVGLFNAVDDYGQPSSAKDGRVYYISVSESRKKYYDSDTISCVANLANLSAMDKSDLLNNIELDAHEFNDAEQMPTADRLIQFIRAEKAFFRPMIQPKDLMSAWYVVPKLSNRRIIAQNGAFLIFGLTDISKPPIDGGKIRFRSINISADDKPKIKEDLALLGITRSSLFPEIDKAAESIVQKYR